MSDVAQSKLTKLITAYKAGDHEKVLEGTKYHGARSDMRGEGGRHVMAATQQVNADGLVNASLAMVQSLVLEQATEALEVARKRINYLAVMLHDPRHAESNDRQYLPKIDAALDAAHVLGVER